MRGDDVDAIAAAAREITAALARAEIQPDDEGLADLLERTSAALARFAARSRAARDRLDFQGPADDTGTSTTSSDE